MTMGGLDSQRSTADNYRMFSREARGRSPAYESLAASVADDDLVLEFLGTLPSAKRQPNLLFAAARYLLDGPPGIGTLRTLVRLNGTDLAQVMLARRTQTNEPARCATLLPALARLPEPLALIEVGASAGLTMLFDRYSYDYDGHLVAGSDPDAPTLRCAVRGPVPLPARLPVIAWRAGLDLNPLDVTRDDDVRWLSCLVWPGEGDRLDRLAAAIASARRDPPTVYRGDLVTDLPSLAAQAPAEATLVIYHSAVLAYVAAQDRERFARTVRGLGAAWLSSEAPGVVPGLPHTRFREGTFVLGHGGRTPLAFADGHGTWLHWLDGESRQRRLASLRAGCDPSRAGPAGPGRRCRG
jgi:prepilin-type processing-associated H-X9-DG protein